MSGFVNFALRRPVTIFVAVLAIALLSLQAVRKMGVDIFPSLNLPVIYVAQPYGGMDPAQMEGLITNYYEYHFLYINGIHHVESRNVQGMALMKLHFHPGTNMSQAMAETISYVNRARAFMPPGTVNPFVTRFDTGSVPVGYLVLSSESGQWPTSKILRCSKFGRCFRICRRLGSAAIRRQRTFGNRALEDGQSSIAASHPRRSH